MSNSRFRGILAGVVASAALITVPAFAATTLSVTNAAAINGTTFGLQVNFSNGTENAFVQDNTPNAELNFYGTFYLRDNLMTMVPAETHQVFRGRTQPGAIPAFRVQVKRANDNSNFILFVWARNDNGTFTAPIQTFVPNAHKITIEWHRSSGVNTNDGSIKLYKGNSLIGQVLTVDNDTMAIDDIQLGAFGGVDTTTTGQQHFDEYVSTRAAQF